jgi:diguanylate cyclase (GGDEF)-like protein
LDVHRKGGRLAVCLIDLDGFKRINDTFGHDAGDRLLQEQGRRIAAGLRRGTVARMGGDEFTLLIRDFDREEIPALVMNKIIDELRQPVDILGQQVVTTASIGIAVYPDDGSTADALLKNADSAMYHAKSRGRNCCQFYTESMTAAAMEQLELESQLRGAIEREEFFVEYQPVFEADSRRIDGVEALVRWRHPTRGIVPPGLFIPVAEETGLIAEIGKWVLHRACSDIASLLAQEGEPLHLAVNVSAVQFSNPDLPAQVEAILLQTGFPAQQLVLEMTESMLIESVDDTLHRLKELRRVGARLSIDDFGTGYSSLSYLKYFSIDFLKIDRSFITDLSRRADDVAITKAIIAMAHSLSLEVIAEGVETEGQLRFLQEQDCEYAQGFLLSPALALDALAKLLRSE